MRFLTIFISLCLFIMTASTHAKDIPFIDNLRSVEVERITALPKTDRYMFAEGHADLGYAYEEYSIFYLPFWARAGDGPVIYRQDGDKISYLKVTPIIAAELTADLNRDALAKYHFSRLKHMWGWLVLSGIIGLIYVRKKGMKRSGTTS
jgi:hypothetical protein